MQNLVSARSVHLKAVYLEALQYPTVYQLSNTVVAQKSVLVLLFGLAMLNSAIWHLTIWFLETLSSKL